MVYDTAASSVFPVRFTASMEVFMLRMSFMASNTLKTSMPFSADFSMKDSTASSG